MSDRSSPTRLGVGLRFGAGQLAVVVGIDVSDDQAGDVDARR